MKFLEGGLHFFDEVGGGEGLGEKIEAFEGEAILNAIVGDDSAEHQDGQAVGFGAQKVGGVVTGHVFDVGADDQQIGLGSFQLFQLVNGGAQITGGVNGIALVLQRFLNDGAQKCRRNEEKNRGVQSGRHGLASSDMGSAAG